MPMFFMHEEVMVDLMLDDEDDAEAPPPQIIEEHQRRFKKAGIAPSLNWFKAAACGLDKADFARTWERRVRLDRQPSHARMLRPPAPKSVHKAAGLLCCLYKRRGGPR